MGNSLKLYHTIMEFLFNSAVRMHDIRVFSTFGWAIVGLLFSHEVSLNRWCQHRPGEAKAASKVRRLSRWLHNARVEVGSIYRPLISQALASYAGEELVLALDTSQLWNRYVIIRLGLVYRGRAVPVVWTVLPGESATVAFKTYEPLLKSAVDLLPKEAQVVFLADRGFVHQGLFDLLVDLNWRFCIRIKQSGLIYRSDFTKTKVSRLMPKRGEVRFVHHIWLTGHRFGPVHLALGHVQTENGYEKWAIVSDRKTGLHTFDEYGLRFDVEENFLDDKSGGFQLENSLIRDAQALTRLCLVLAAATLYLVSTGVGIVTLGWRHVVDSHWKRGLSYFKIGWRWIEYALTNDNFLLRFSWLDPGPDLHPVSASKAQDSAPKVIVYAISSLL
jgi:hypothetical protein